MTREINEQVGDGSEKTTLIFVGEHGWWKLKMKSRVSMGRLKVGSI